MDLSFGPLRVVRVVLRTERLVIRRIGMHCLDQRTKDLQVLAVQVRGFDLAAYLSDCEEPGVPVP